MSDPSSATNGDWDAEHDRPMTDATELDEAAVRAAVEGADARQWTEEWWRCHADGYFRAAMGAVPELVAYFAAITPTNMRLLLDEITRLRAALDEALDQRDSVQFALDGFRSVARRDNEHLIARAEAAEREARRLRGVCEDWGSNYQSWVDATHEAEARAEAAESAIAAVRALADEYVARRDRLRRRTEPDSKRPADQMDRREANAWDVAAHEIRAALATPTAQGGGQ